MNIESAMPFDPDSDLHEFGLIAAAVADFPDALLRALLAPAADGKAGPGSGYTDTDRAAA